MPPVGDGFVRSINHPHFIKVLIGFILIMGLTWYSYHRWFKENSTEKPQAEYRAQDSKAIKTDGQIQFQLKK